MPQAPINLKSFSSLMQLVNDLRGPDGCPWDKQQTSLSLTPFAIEEVYELVDAIENGQSSQIKDELGDVLFQVMLHSQIASEENKFSIEDVILNLNEKLIRRHPHVFSDTNSTTDKSSITLSEIKSNWQKIKEQEKFNSAVPKNKIQSEYFNFPKNLPALQKSFKIGLKSEQLKFDWNNADDVFKKVQEELDELQTELNTLKSIKNKTNSSEDLVEVQKKASEEFGDLLFSLCQWARHLKIEPEQCLRFANDKFELRFNKMIQLSQSKGLIWDQLTDSEKEKLWSEIKQSQFND